VELTVSNASLSLMNEKEERRGGGVGRGGEQELPRSACHQQIAHVPQLSFPSSLCVMKRRARPFH